MIGISKLYCGTVEPSDVLRYGARSKDLPSHLLQFAADKKPVVVWNCTRRCNLRCVHCYSHSADRNYPGELTTQEAEAFIEDIAAFGAPVILFSGGEPLMRPDLFDLIARATKAGLRAVISTNGTLIEPEVAERLKEFGLSYVGVSLDGMRETNDKFRGREGAFDHALAGIRNCRQAGIKVGLRFTINKRNAADVGDIFTLLRDEDIPRVCFYHLVYAGRGTALMKEDLDHEQTRRVVDLIIDRTAELHAQGLPKEVLTVDNHADGPYLYLRMLREGNPRAQQVWELLQMNQGNSSGNGIGCVSWDGSVHPDQFWRHVSLGNVKERPFSQVWTDLSNPLLARLKDKRPYVTGRCATCRFLNVCGGNFRVRAEAATGDLWAPDPACYLSDEEIARQAAEVQP
ncbi:MAG: Antilisterial bacteriocin subtilosin biosynthesis protein AlbA [Planctomycetes bacterium ADurb.Bin126]|nr:MAG: Antilisterial bacteriocin subtilosin biosynthesis protein AlbA [Planctomycetes bacterium ADurb.Bin126]HOD80584.1 12,18-didecarboxysiroheme deacetylase [Phycisphaerae bacterium]HQL75814.1 12,18-didecarboxysiroheme deacetylase [Phycisphaerae bacterium]